MYHFLYSCVARIAEEAFGCCEFCPVVVIYTPFHVAPTGGPRRIVFADMTWRLGIEGEHYRIANMMEVGANNALKLISGTDWSLLRVSGADEGSRYMFSDTSRLGSALAVLGQTVHLCPQIERL
jgi:hypothetical protein